MSVDIKITQATADDVHRYVPLARVEHRAEVEAMGGDAETLTQKTFAMSGGRAWTVTFDGEPAVLFGVIPGSLLTGHGLPWVLTTSVVDHHHKTFYQLSRQIVAALRQDFPILSSSIHAKFEKSLRWARRLGFIVLDARPCGAKGAPFHPVIKGGV